MKKKLNIFIDYGGDKDASDEQFAEKLKNRIKSIAGNFIVETYGDKVKNETEKSENVTQNAIDNADIIIPIITPDYFNISVLVDETFNEIIQSKNKYLFPILFKSADWVDFNWMVKSQPIPEDGIPLYEHSENDSDKIINRLILTIKEILDRTSNPQKTKLVIDEIDVPKKNNIVFISHDHEDGDFAELLKLQLEKHGIKGWIDNERLKIGQDWREEIDHSIDTSLAVIAIMTPESRKSEYVTYEWAYAWGKGKKIYPLMLKQTPLHPRLESLQYLDFTKRNSRPFEKLIESLRDLMK